jgi:phosphatidylglycerol:prolipoprotein diacylglycerol transferase
LYYSGHAVLPTFSIPFTSYHANSYALIRTAYILVALFLTLELNERQGISSRKMMTAFAIVAPAGILGAHILDMLEYWGSYRTWTDICAQSGSSIYGAFVVAFIAVFPIARCYEISALRILDAGGPVLALGEAMTRIGCFLNGCCYGITWDGSLAVVFPRTSFAFRDQVARGVLSPEAAYSLPVHPVQLYSFAISLGATIILSAMFAKPHREGTIFFAFILFYGFLRLLMAPFRVEALLSMTLFSLLFILIGVTGIATQARRPIVVPSMAVIS